MTPITMTESQLTDPATPFHLLLDEFEEQVKCLTELEIEMTVSPKSRKEETKRVRSEILERLMKTDRGVDSLRKHIEQNENTIANLTRRAEAAEKALQRLYEQKSARNVIGPFQGEPGEAD